MTSESLKIKLPLKPLSADYHHASNKHDFCYVLPTERSATSKTKAYENYCSEFYRKHRSLNKIVKHNKLPNNITVHSKYLQLKSHLDQKFAAAAQMNRNLAYSNFINEPIVIEDDIEENSNDVDSDAETVIVETEEAINNDNTAINHDSTTEQPTSHQSHSDENLSDSDDDTIIYSLE
nr:Caab138 [Calliteara abietis nucleopolyhedrovirus]